MKSSEHQVLCISSAEKGSIALARAWNQLSYGLLLQDLVCLGRGERVDAIWLQIEAPGRFEVQEGTLSLESESIFLCFRGWVEGAGPLVRVPMCETLASGPKLRRHTYLSCQEKQHFPAIFEKSKCKNVTDQQNTQILNKIRTQ